MKSVLRWEACISLSILLRNSTQAHHQQLIAMMLRMREMRSQLLMRFWTDSQRYFITTLLRSFCVRLCHPLPSLLQLRGLLLDSDWLRWFVRCAARCHSWLSSTVWVWHALSFSFATQCFIHDLINFSNFTWTPVSSTLRAYTARGSMSQHRHSCFLSLFFELHSAAFLSYSSRLQRISWF